MKIIEKNDIQTKKTVSSKIWIYLPITFVIGSIVIVILYFTLFTKNKISSNELNDIQNTLSEKESAIADKQAVISEIDSEITDCQKDNSSKESRIAELQNSSDEKDSEISRLEDEIDECEKAKKEAEEAAAKANSYDIERIDKSYAMLDYYYDQVVLQGQFANCNNCLASKASEFFEVHDDSMAEYSQWEHYWGETWFCDEQVQSVEFYQNKYVSVVMVLDWFMGGVESHDIYAITLDKNGNEPSLAQMLGISEDEAKVIIKNAAAEYLIQCGESTDMLDYYPPEGELYISGGNLYISFPTGSIGGTYIGNVIVHLGEMDSPSYIVYRYYY